MTQSASYEKPLTLSAEADPLDDVFDRVEERPAGGSKQVPPVRRSRPVSRGWPVALVASLVWIATVAAFCWARYSLPDNPGDAMDVVGSRIGLNDWLMIGAAIAGPLLLIWLAAWLIRRTSEMRRETQDLASAALRLAHATKSVESGVPLALGNMGEVTGETPRHLRREVERATHAISALHSQMRAIEEALSTQAAAIDDVAERAEKRARNISSVLRTEREALERMGGASGEVPVAPALSGAIGAGVGAAAVGAAGLAAASSDVTDFSLDSSRIEAAAGADASGELLSDAPTMMRDGEDHDPNIGEVLPTADIDQSDTRIDISKDVPSLRAQLADAKANARWERPTLPEDAGLSLDPFDDIAAEPEADLSASGVAAGLGMGAMGGLASAAPAALDQEPDEYEALDLDTVIEDAEEPLHLERRHVIDWQKFARAANFPESEEDTETLDALYDVLTDPEAASLLQCAEDTLASLADIDLYMEDFLPPLVPVSAWRAHLDGTGGDPVKGIQAPVEQSRIRAKLNSDKGFEHLCTKFMDRYEGMGRRLLDETNSSQLIVDLSNTRTGRAYLMIADSAGRLGA